MPDKPLSCVLLADRHHGLSEGVRGLLETAFGSVVMVADEASLVDAASRLLPDVAVVDLSLARERGLGWLRVVRERCPDLKIIGTERSRRTQRAPRGDGRRRGCLRAQTRDRNRPAGRG